MAYMGNSMGWVTDGTIIALNYLIDLIVMDGAARED